jgi:proline iminopeptidase
LPPLPLHYWSHGCFLTDRHIPAGLPSIASIPATLIHGRHDISGPLDTAWHLHLRWPASTLRILVDAGHGGDSFSNEIRRALRSTPR